MNDLISRSALIRFIDVGHFRHPAELCYSELDVANLIKNFPAVDTVPVVHGRWKRILRGNYECSHCGCIPYYAGSIYTLHYCPHCGAKMDGERKDE